MTPMTILIDEVPRCVVRPNDQKALSRFIRNSRTYLLAGREGAAITHRPAEAAELARFQDALGLHRACGGDEDEFAGVPL